MKTINWTQASELGLVERINREILHPLGLAMSYHPNTGTSEALLIADDGFWEYSPNLESKVIADDEVKRKVLQLRDLPTAEALNLRKPDTIDIVKITQDGDIDPQKLKPLISSFPKGTMVWFANPGDSIEVLDESKLNDMGWFRKGDNNQILGSMNGDEALGEE